MLRALVFITQFCFQLFMHSPTKFCVNRITKHVRDGIMARCFSLKMLPTYAWDVHQLESEIQFRHWLQKPELVLLSPIRENQVRTCNSLTWLCISESTRTHFGSPKQSYENLCENRVLTNLNPWEWCLFYASCYVRLMIDYQCRTKHHVKKLRRCRFDTYQ